MVTPLFVYAIMRSTQQHSQLIGLYETEAHAEREAASYNEQFQRGVRAVVSRLMVQTDSKES